MYIIAAPENEHEWLERLCSASIKVYKNKNNLRLDSAGETLAQY